MKAGDIICQKGYPDYKGIVVEVDPYVALKGEHVRVCWYDEWVVSIWEVADIELVTQSQEK